MLYLSISLHQLSTTANRVKSVVQLVEAVAAIQLWTTVQGGCSCYYVRCNNSCCICQCAQLGGKRRRCTWYWLGLWLLMQDCRHWLDWCKYGAQWVGQGLVQSPLVLACSPLVLAHPPLVVRQKELVGVGECGNWKRLAMLDLLAEELGVVYWVGHMRWR